MSFLRGNSQLALGVFIAGIIGFYTEILSALISVIVLSALNQFTVVFTVIFLVV